MDTRELHSSLMLNTEQKGVYYRFSFALRQQAFAVTLQTVATGGLRAVR